MDNRFIFEGIGGVVKRKEERECSVLFFLKRNIILLCCLRNYFWNKILRFIEILLLFFVY